MENYLKGEELIAKAESLTIHSGNILYKLLRTSEEICQSFCGTVKQWISENSKSCDDQVDPGSLYINNESNTDAAQDVKRDDLKYSLKLFLQETDAAVVRQAVLTVIEELKCSSLDSVLLSLPPTSQSGNDTFRNLKYESIQDIWMELESLFQAGSIRELGVCDLDAVSLKDLHDSAKVKPVVNQVDLQNCCQPPDDLAVFAAENDITLLTHNDPTEILPQKTLQCVLPDGKGTRTWKPSYLARYSSVVKGREIVKLRGYFLCMKAAESG